MFSLRRADLMFFRFRRASFTRSKGFFALKEKTERRREREREMGEVRKAHKKKVPSSLLSLSKNLSLDDTQEGPLCFSSSVFFCEPNKLLNPSTGETRANNDGE